MTNCDIAGTFMNTSEGVELQGKFCKLQLVHVCWPQVRGCPKFKNSIFILPRPHKRCLMISPSKEIFRFCSKFDHKLLGTNTILVQAVFELGRRQK